jgi:mono/diheme cytochrome c family protein
MRTALFVAGLGVAIGAATLVFGQPKSSPQVSAPPVRQPPGASASQVERGKYLTALGDCVACHTQEGGARFAGGRPVETPFGTIVSANITPDQSTGIGGWNADQFYRALHEGIDDEGEHLYPAFPYNYYTRVTREDSDAIFAYLRSIPAMQHRFKRNELRFPFNIRALMIGWNALFLHKGPYRSDPSKSAEWNRGAYLVEGLGHCQACHTPQDMMGAPKKDKAFQGGVFAEWFAPDITANKRVGVGSWDDASLREFLRRGNNVHSAASGEMGEVVAFSTSQMNDADLNAVLTYVRSIEASPDAKVTRPEQAVMKQGEAIWQDACSACHQMDASGVPRYFPPLKQDANLQQSDPTTLVHFILTGTRKIPTDAAPTPLSMPAFYWKLDDQQVAAVATYARNSWGNAASPVTADQVKKLRAKLKVEHLPPEHPQAANLAHPGPNTFAPAGTDSRENGTNVAGRPAPANLQIPTTAAAMGSGPAATSKAAATPEGGNKAPGKSAQPSGGGSGYTNQREGNGSPGGSTGGPG